jgi:hypothetical protein
MKKLSALIALSLCAAPVAYAQDGSSCANAIPMTAPSTVNVDTTGATGWINSFGPLLSPSNDIVYTFTSGDAAPTGTITPTASDYAFAIYALSSCSAGAGPVPIASTGTLNQPINLASTNPATVPNHQYFVAVTGSTAGGAAANGTVTLEITPTLPVTLESFEIN